MFARVTRDIWWALLLFLALLIYLLLRAWFVEPLHDEVATYFFYIYHGDFWGANMVVDANNHLLNSWLCHAIYRVFGDHFFLFRLPNIVAFCIYFFYAYRLSFQWKNPALRWLSLGALVAVPFMTEYFANCRGYGISVAGFLAAYYHITRYALRFRTLDGIAALIAFSIALTANASLLTVGLLIAAYFLGIMLIHRKLNAVLLIALGLFGLLLVAMANYGLLLKKAGALYYGNLNGLWDTTGASIVRYTLFLEGWPAFALVTVLVVALFAYFCYFCFSKEWKDRLKTPFFLSNYLFFGSLTAIVILALLFHVNYPEDRVGMYLIPLFLLVICYIIDQYPRFRYVQWVLLFFPLTFVWKMNLHTSVFSPDDRVSSEFYASVKKHMKPEDNLMVYNTMYWDWIYFESHADRKASVANSIVKELALHDVVLTKTNLKQTDDLFSEYKVIAVNEAASHIAYQRKQPLRRELLFESAPQLFSGKREYLTIYESDSLAYIPHNEPIQISVTGHLKTYDPKHYLQLVVQTFDAAGNQLYREYYPFDCTYQGKLIDASFAHHFVIPKWQREAHVLKVYLWNKGGHSAQGSEGKCYIYKVKSPKNGTR